MSSSPLVTVHGGNWIRLSGGHPSSADWSTIGRRLLRQPVGQKESQLRYHRVRRGRRHLQDWLSELLRKIGREDECRVGEESECPG